MLILSRKINGIFIRFYSFLSRFPTFLCLAHRMASQSDQNLKVCLLEWNCGSSLASGTGFPNTQPFCPIGISSNVLPCELFLIEPIQKNWQKTVLEELGKVISQKLHELSLCKNPSNVEYRGFIAEARS